MDLALVATLPKKPKDGGDPATLIPLGGSAGPHTNNGGSFGMVS